MLNDQPVILIQHSCKMCPLFSKKQPIMLMKHNKNYIKTLIKTIVNHWLYCNIRPAGGRIAVDLPLTG